MSESANPKSSKTKRGRLSVKTSDIIIFGIILVVIIVLVATISSKLTLKHEAANAQVVADKVIADLQKRDGEAAHKLGTKTFQKTYSSALLTRQFKAIEVATLKPPKLDATTIGKSKDGKTAYFVYKYTALKVPYYIRVIVMRSDNSTQWKLTQISGNADESKLLVQ